MGEDTLIDGLKQGDEHCYAEFVRTHSGRLLKIARRYLDEEEARDAVKEAFSNVFESLQEFRGEAGLATRLHSVVINHCLIRLHQSSQTRERSIDEWLPAYLQDGHRANPAPAWQLGADEFREHNELQRLVRELIGQLPESYRRVLMLCDIEGFSCAETAQLLELSVTAVMVRLHQAHQAIRELLEPHIGGTNRAI